MEDIGAINNLQQIKEETAIKENEPSLIKDFFTEEKKESIKDLAELFGQSETELKKEFGTYKAKKVYKKLNYLIDNRIRLKKDLITALETAVKYGFYGVSVYPSALQLSKSALAGSNVKIRVLINYPLGEDAFKTVKYSVKLAREQGADEIAVMLSSFSYKNLNEYDVIKQIKKLIKTAKNKKLILMIDSANLSRIELENAIKTSICCGVSNVLILNEKSRVDRETLDDAIKISSDKIFIECKDTVSSSEQTVSMFVSGIDFLTTEYAPEIVKDLSVKINGDLESGCKPLDKTDKE